jgi:hypothetical protein
MKIKRLSTYQKRMLMGNTPKICYYCGITEKDCREYFKNHPELTRGGHRGLSLEVDRKDSNLAYTKDNVVWACYVCNNSKSNYCNSAEEFEPIAKGIRETWIKRGYNPK